MSRVLENSPMFGPHWTEGKGGVTFVVAAGALAFKAEVHVSGPSSNGRTADFGSVNGGSNPPGPIELSSSEVPP